LFSNYIYKREHKRNTDVNGQTSTKYVMELRKLFYVVLTHCVAWLRGNFEMC